MEVGNERGSEPEHHARIAEDHPRSKDERVVPRWDNRIGTDGGSRTSSPSLAACSRRSCSRTSSTRPVGCASSATGPGRSCCGRTTLGSAIGCGRSAVARSMRRGTASWRRSTVASRAVAFACGFHAEVLDLHLEVRTGVHTGECELDDGRLRGVAVHVGARLAGLARPGEVLVSSTVRDVVAGSGLRFTDRGLHELRGVPGQRRVVRRSMERGREPPAGWGRPLASGGRGDPSPIRAPAREHRRRRVKARGSGVDPGPRAYPSRAPRNSSV